MLHSAAAAIQRRHNCQGLFYQSVIDIDTDADAIHIDGTGLLCKDLITGSISIGDQVPLAVENEGQPGIMGVDDNQSLATVSVIEGNGQDTAAKLFAVQNLD